MSIRDQLAGRGPHRRGSGRGRRASLGVLAAIAGLSLAAPGDAAARAPVPGLLQGAVVSATDHDTRLTVTPAGQTGGVTLSVARADDQAKVRLMAVKDQVKLNVDDLASPTQVTSVAQISRPLGTGPVLLALFAALLALLAASLAVTGYRPQAFVIGVDNRYSNSQCQLTLWFGTLATVYAATVILRFLWLGPDFIGGVGVTGNVMALTGLSALSFGGAKVITTQKADDPKQAAAAPVDAAKPDLLHDLVQDASGRADLGDFQMILITLTAVAIFGLASFHFLTTLPVETATTLPDVDTTLLSGFGLGQGAYLLKKAASPLGKG
jgi:hypothetical protein